MGGVAVGRGFVPRVVAGCTLNVAGCCAFSPAGGPMRGTVYGLGPPMGTSASVASPTGGDPFADFSSVITKLVSLARAPPHMVVTSSANLDSIVFDKGFLVVSRDLYLSSQLV